jgi:hypothetical protein
MTKPLLTSRAPVGFTSACSQLMQVAVNEYAPPDMSPELHAELETKFDKVARDTQAEQFIFKGVFNGVPLTAKMFVGCLLAMTWIPIVDGHSEQLGKALALTALLVLSLPAAIRAGEHILAPARNSFESQTFYASIHLIVVIEAIVGALFFIGSYVLGIISLQYYGIRFAWKISGAIQTLKTCTEPFVKTY